MFHEFINDVISGLFACKSFLPNETGRIAAKLTVIYFINVLRENAREVRFFKGTIVLGIRYARYEKTTR